MMTKCLSNELKILCGVLQFHTLQSIPLRFKSVCLCHDDDDDDNDKDDDDEEVFFSCSDSISPMTISTHTHIA